MFYTKQEYRKETDGRCREILKKQISMLEIPVPQAGGSVKQLYDFAVREKLKGIRKTTQSNGKAFFDSLEEGVYLCSATADIALEGYRYHSAPFLVFVPSGEGIYHVTVEPKSEWVGRPTEPPVENSGRCGGKA